MLDDDRGDPLRSDDRGDDVHDRRLLAGADAAGRFVEEEEPRPQRVSDRHVEQLALPLRQPIRRDAPFIREPELSDDTPRLLFGVAIAFGEAHHLVDLVVAGEDREPDVVEHRQGVEQVYELKAPRDPGLDPAVDRQPGHVLPVEDDPPLVRLQEPGDQIHERGLARAVRSHERDQALRLDRKVDAVDRAGVAKRLPEPVDGQQRHLSPPSASGGGGASRRP